MPTTVVGAFDELLGRLELTSTQSTAAQRHIDNVKAFLHQRFAVDDKGAWGTGSYSRRTLTRWQRDVDVMVPLSVSKYDAIYGDDSRKFLYLVRDALNEKYGSTAVSSRQISVKLDFSDFVVDVVPCFRRKGGGYLIPNGSRGWRGTNPPFHFTLMKDANEAHDGRLKPLVKLLKAWNIANGHHLASFHVELMVERMWRGHSIGKYPAAVASTLKTMPSWLGSSFADPWADGRPIDADLPRSDRDTAIRMLEEDAKGAEQAERYREDLKAERAFERWDVIYRQKFPAYG